MRGLARSVGKMFLGSRSYDPLRDAWQWVGNREGRRHRGALRAWYEPFVGRGDLVFDVGANRGQHTTAFVELGARVVAVEPNPACVAHLRRRFRNRRVAVESVAVGAAVGEATLHLADADTLSTLSEEWMANCQSQGRFGETVWEGEVRVPVRTLDGLCSIHGKPAFIKIDVEGFEEEVVKGLSSLPPALCYEFNTEAFDSVVRVISQLLGLGARYFCLRHGVGGMEGPGNWVSASEAEGQIRAISARGYGRFGDVFAVQQIPKV